MWVFKVPSLQISFVMRPSTDRASRTAAVLWLVLPQMNQKSDDVIWSVKAGISIVFVPAFT